ncbi:putative F-box protein At1g49610 [Salvia miltiorrhiza]|uniref:putative F-box protein At1g49610 n=1 Tax=Salvia miltiorrhiza TaxID=226208 RepID=UPI0025AC4A15|nr:putative F-box protein At1g49610 [Salvia miltiorrhiza]
MDQSQESESGSLDRLSDLPDSLILEILLLLWEIRDVVRTTILSKRWKDLWTTVPRLDFHFCDEDPNFIRGVLAQWKGAKILNFSITFISHDPPSSDIIDSLLLLAMEKQVAQLTMLGILRGDFEDSVVNAVLGIWAPNLLNFILEAHLYGTCLLDVPSLTKATLIIDDPPPLETFEQLLRSIRHVEKLRLSDECIQLLHEMKEKDMVVQFSNANW